MIFSLIYFSTISVFLNLFKYYSFFSGLPSYIFYMLIDLFIISYYLFSTKKFIFSKPLMIWMIFYFTLITIYYMLSGFGGVIEYKRYVPTVTVIVIFVGYSLLYSLDDDNLYITRKAIILSMFIAVLLLVYDFIYPGSFIIGNKDAFLAGRALATYGNQNIVGAVLILGLILTIDLIPKNYKMYYIIYIFIGIAVTFSRSNLIIFFIILLIMAFQNKISRISVGIIYIILFSILLWLGMGGLEWLGDEYNIEISPDLLNRVNFFVDTKDSDTSDMNERKMVLQAALDMFADKPIFGNGFASTSAGIWPYRVGPHNAFARTWAEFGFFGFLIIPSFLIASTCDTLFSKKNKYSGMAVLFIIYYVLSSFFSHNMLDQDFNYIGAIIIATLGYKNKRKGIYAKKEN